MLESLTFRQKLLLLLLFPSLGFLGFAGAMLEEKRAQFNVSNQLISDVDVFVDVGDVIHNLQKERAITINYVGSGGTKMTDKLPSTRADSDKEFVILLNQIKQKNFHLTEIEAIKKSLEEWRQKADSLHGVKDDYAAAYTKMIQTFIDIISLASQKITHPDAIHDANTYLSFLVMKERTGRSRAQIAVVLSNGKSDLTNLLKVSANISAFEANYATFSKQASREQLDFYEKTVTGNAVEEVERIKKLVLTSPLDIEIGVDVNHWIDVMTQRINLMKTVEDGIANDLKQTAQTVKSEMIFNLSVIVISLIALFCITAFVIRQIITQLTKQLGGEPKMVVDVVKQIARGNFASNISLQRGDQGSLLYSVSQMRDSLNILIKEISHVMNETANGRLSTRISSDFQGDFNQIKISTNHSLDAIENTLNEVVSVTHAIAQGDLSHKISGDYQGAFKQTQESVNYTVTEISKIIEEVSSIVYSGAECGDFSVKMSLSNKVGYGKDLAQLINQLFETTEKSVNDVLRITKSLAAGDLTQRIDDDYAGLFAATKVAMNATVDNLKNLIGEIKATSEIVASAANEISSGNVDLSNRTEKQAASLQETAAK
jgi:methyl-accepting chemotaxis protein